MIKISVFLDIPEEETINSEDIGEIMEAAVEGLDNRGYVVTGIIGQKAEVEVESIDDDTITLNEDVDEDAIVSWGEEVYR